MFAQTQEAPPAEPPELAALRAQYEERKAVILKPIKDQHDRELRNLLDNLIRTGRSREALAVQRYTDALARGEEPPAPAESDPVDLRTLRDAFARQSESAAQTLRQQYLAQLKILEANLSRRRELAAALKVREEWESLQASGDAPGLPRFDWRRERVRVNYRYVPEKFSHGKINDYSDAAGTKLLDGKLDENYGPQSTGWGKELEPSKIIIQFQTPVAPTRFQLHANIPPASIVIREGNATGPGKVIGQNTEIGAQAGWIEVPLTLKRPSSHFWIELERRTPWLLIDEIEFR